MTNTKPPQGATVIERHDPFKIRGIEQLLSLFNGGEFLEEVLQGDQNLRADLIEHLELHGPKGCQGEMTIKISYALGKQFDVVMGATATFKPPKKPASSAAAFIDDKGDLTLYSPLMARMHTPVRDVQDYDPATGEIKDVD